MTRLLSHPGAKMAADVGWDAKIVKFFKFVLDIDHVMFKYYDSLREDVLLIVLSLIIVRDMIIGSIFA